MSVCPRCGASFACGEVDGGMAPCWCAGLPPLMPDSMPTASENARCYCERCLRALIDRHAEPEP